MSTIDELKQKTQAFIHHYLNVSADDEQAIASFALTTWLPLYENTTYLLFVGGPGSGNSRAGVLMNALCKSPVVATGYSLTALLQKMDKSYPCTLIVDMDMPTRARDDKGYLVRILEGGHRRGNGFIRLVAGEFVSYEIYGYKVILSSRTFTNNAIQGYCITIRLSSESRTDIPEFLLRDFDQAAAKLREEIRAHFEGVKA